MPHETPRAQAQTVSQSFEGLPSIHMVTYARNASTGDFRAICTCGWCRVGPGRDEEAIRGQAAVHDLAWVRVMNEARS